MSLTKLLAFTEIIVAPFFPMKDYAQLDDGCKMVEGKYKICFEEKPHFNSFLTNEFIDSLRVHKGKPFNFNGVEFDGNNAILNPETMDFVKVYSFEFIDSDFPKVSLYIGGYQPISQNGIKETKKGTFVYGLSSPDKDFFYSLELLKQKGVFQEQEIEKIKDTNNPF